MKIHIQPDDNAGQDTDQPSAPNPSSKIVIGHDKVKNMTVGSPVTFKVHGVIKSIRPLHEDHSLYEVSVEKGLVEKEESGIDEAPEESENLATMPRKDLKSMISKHTDDEEDI